MLNTWSFSSLSVFEQCPHRSYLSRIARIPEPPRQENNAGDRGTRIHKEIENYVRGISKTLPLEAQTFANDIDAVRRYHRAGQAEVENLWAFDTSWRSIHPDSPQVWGRVVIDVFVLLNDTTAAILDWKTGKRRFNEVKHAAQASLYQLAAFLRFPQLEKIYTEFCYLDIDEIARIEYTRKQGLKFLAGLQDRAQHMTTTTTFPAKPNEHNCHYCPYGKVESSNKYVTKNGACIHGL